MKKIIAFLLVLALSVMTFAACSDKGNDEKGENTGDQKNVKVGIITLVENSAFTDMKAGIVEGLKEKGYIEGENTTVDYQCAGGDNGTLATIASSMADGTYDAVFCIATPAALSFLTNESETPCFFCAVSAPVASGVVTDLVTHAGNVTGTSNAIPVGDIFALADVLTPGYSKVGLISSGTESNATNTINQAEEYLKGKNIESFPVISETSADVETTANALVAAGCDIVFIPNDSVVQAGVSKLAEICNEKGIPTYTSSVATVSSGCFATVAIDDVDIGKLTAGMFDEFRSGKAVADIPVIVCDAEYCTVTVNTAAREALNIEIPESVNASYID